MGYIEAPQGRWILTSEVVANRGKGSGPKKLIWALGSGLSFEIRSVAVIRGPRWRWILAARLGANGGNGCEPQRGLIRGLGLRLGFEGGLEVPKGTGFSRRKWWLMREMPLNRKEIDMGLRLWKGTGWAMWDPKRALETHVGGG